MASETPQQTLTSLQTSLANYTTQYNQYNQHYQTYAPGLISELSASSTALATFGADVAILSNAVATLNQDTSDLAIAQANLANQPTVISTTAVSVDVARAAYETAATAYNAIHPQYTTALAERNSAFTAYQNTATGGTITETFNNNQKQTAAQFLVSGTTALSTTNNQGYSITGYEYGGQYFSGGMIKAYMPTATLTIIPPNQTATTFFQFATGALNGDMTISVIYTDGSTGSFVAPNGVYQENAVNSYNLTQEITAPTGKYIQSITIPAYGDYYYMDSFVFTSQAYDAALYAVYLQKQQALDAVLVDYTPAATAYNTAVANLSLAESTYNTARDASTTAALQALVTSEQTTYDASLVATQTAITNALASKEVIADALAAVILPPDSMEVTSTSDEYVPGTLRWALTQTNALSGSIYDRIKIKTSGTLTLTGNLPTVAGSLEIIGPSNSDFTINGADLYSAFYMANSGATLRLSNMTVEHTKRTDWQQGSGVFIARGTAHINNVTFQDILTGSAVTTKEGGSYVNITNSNFKRIAQYGVFSNYGGTPSTTTEADTQYDNRIIITGTTFENNGNAIYGERTIIVDSSTFKNNGYAFRMQGINKHRVTNSLFEGNQVAIYSSSWIPTTWTTFFSYPSRVITGNIFKKTSNIPIAIDDRMNDGKSTALTALITGNSWDESSQYFVRYGHYDTNAASNQTYYLSLQAPSVVPPFTFTNTTSIKPVIEAPSNVAVTSNQDGSITVAWTAPLAVNTIVERYAVSWTTEGANGWGVAATGTSITLPREVFATTGGLGKTYLFTVRADNDTIALYSPTSTAVTAEVAAPPAPAPQQTASPVAPEPTTQPTAEPTTEPTPEPTIEPTPEPTVEPTVEPIVEPTPEPQPSPEPEPTPEPEEPQTVEESLAVIDEIATIEDPKDLTEAQVEELISAAEEVLASAEQGSPEYEQALEALAVAAEADDPEIPTELAAIPLLGDVAGAALEVFNNLGNVGADMAPAVREEAEKTVIASVIAAGAAVNAVAAATTASSGAAGGASSGGSSGGSGSTRRKE